MSLTKEEIKRKLSVVRGMLQEAEKLLDTLQEVQPEVYMEMIENQMSLINVILNGLNTGKLQKDDVVDDKFVKVLKGVTEAKKRQLDVEMSSLQAELINDIKNK